MNQMLTVTSSPHIHSPASTRRVMLDVVIALLPAALAGVIIFGWRALAVLCVCVITAILCEFLFNLITKKEQTIGDFSAVVTGLLLGMNLHAQVAFWQCALGTAIAIIVVKCLFGGLGCNFANPAITGRVFLLIAFPAVGGGAMPVVGKWLSSGNDLVTSATTLTAIGTEGASLPSLFDMFFGVRAGAIGETCIFALLIGFIYLVCRRVIKWYVPMAYIGTVFLLSLAFCRGDVTDALYYTLSGGVFIAAIFMATDYVTTPITNSGRVLFSVGCGLITVLIRFYGAYPEGASFSILLMNILSPYLEKWTAKKPLGGVKA